MLLGTQPGSLCEKEETGRRGRAGPAWKGLQHAPWWWADPVSSATLGFSPFHRRLPVNALGGRCEPGVPGLEDSCKVTVTFQAINSAPQALIPCSGSSLPSFGPFFSSGDPQPCLRPQLLSLSLSHSCPVQFSKHRAPETPCYVASKPPP